MQENIFIPDQSSKYLKRTTHLSIGAHQDDLEIMSLDGIVKCIDRDDLWFGGIVCTDGAGSSRIGEYASYTDQQMKDVRVQEQIDAAIIGQYSFVAQLGFTSSDVKKIDDKLVHALKNYLLKIRPKVVYTHNPFDKHATHVAVFKATILALQEIKDQYMPEQFLGCEVWRNLDWCDDKQKIALDTSGHEQFILKILSVFRSQVVGGKRYDLATIGRMRANATYFDSHNSDNSELVTFAIDLLPLINQMTLENFIQHYTMPLISSFKINLLR